ncbi:MAG: glycosyltransferase family 2 protein, partial [Sphingobacteriaceae bacterium]
MKISVVIPCYNCADFISKAIESVFKQEWADYEIILVDNNSTDDTLSIIQDYGIRYPDTITVLSETKKGAPATRNKGLSVATGDWIQFLDSDDELLPGKFKRQAEIIANTGADIISGAYINVQVFSGKFKSIRKLYHTTRIMSGSVKGEINGYTLNTTRTPSKGDHWKALIGGKLGITSANL